MKITDKDIAKFFGMSPATLRQYKNGTTKNPTTPELERRYVAFKEFYEKEHSQEPNNL